MQSWYLYFFRGVSPYKIFNVLFVLTEFDKVLDRLQQGPSQPSRPVIETTDTSGDQSINSSSKKKVRSKNTCKLKKAWSSDELARLFVTGPTDPVAKPNLFTVSFVGVICLC